MVILMWKGFYKSVLYFCQVKKRRAGFALVWSGMDYFFLSLSSELGLSVI